MGCLVRQSKLPREKETKKTTCSLVNLSSVKFLITKIYKNQPDNQNKKTKSRKHKNKIMKQKVKCNFPHFTLSYTQLCDANNCPIGISLANIYQFSSGY